MTESIQLWLVNLISPVAFFEQTVLEIVKEPELIAVPYCHPLAQEMLIRDNSWIPVIRLHDSFDSLLVLNTADHHESPQLAITVPMAPEKIETSDNNFVSDISNIPGIFKNVAVSAVTVNDIVVPILKPSNLLNDQWLCDALRLKKSSPANVTRRSQR